jgi:transposase InsO family protein
MQTELFNTKTWTTVEELSIAVADYSENFHNTRRRHYALDMLTTAELETLNTPAAPYVSPEQKRGQIKC